MCLRTEIFSGSFTRIRIKPNVMSVLGQMTKDGSGTHCSGSAALRSRWGIRSCKCPAEVCSGHRCDRAPWSRGDSGTWLRCWNARHSPPWGWAYPSEWSRSSAHRALSAGVTSVWLRRRLRNKKHASRQLATFSLVAAYFKRHREEINWIWATVESHIWDFWDSTSLKSNINY